MSSCPRGTWQRQGHEDFVSILLAKEHGAKTFPCIHATKGYRADELHYLFIHSDDPSEPRNVALIATALHGYLHVAKATGFHTSLIIMAPRIDDLARPKSIEDYRQSYWRMCKRLRTFDSKPWPKHIPEDTSSEQWCWCFEGIPSFMAVMTPAHEKRRSRYSPNFCIIYQPKWIFESLYSTAEKREAASKKVRDLIGEYDEIPISLDITHYGEPFRVISRLRQSLIDNLSREEGVCEELNWRMMSLALSKFVYSRSCTSRKIKIIRARYIGQHDFSAQWIIYCQKNRICKKCKSALTYPPHITYSI